VIGIAGSGPSVGATHLAILTANFVTGVQKQKAAVLEWNGSGDFGRLEQILSKNAVTDRQPRSFNILGTSYYKKAGKNELLECSGHGVDTVVIDFGVCREEILEEFLRCDRRFLVGSASTWQLPCLASLVSRPGLHRSGWEYFCVFGSEETIRMTERLLGIQIRQIPLAQNAFAITGEILAFFGEFLK